MRGVCADNKKLGERAHIIRTLRKHDGRVVKPTQPSAKKGVCISSPLYSWRKKARRMREIIRNLTECETSVVNPTRPSMKDNFCISSPLYELLSSFLVFFFDTFDVCSHRA